ncbi:hypothetical protein C5167_027188 [Papaver somniferum]|nr:hypothetical protein C5167_027188 [Papaver somniferum]
MSSRHLLRVYMRRFFCQWPNLCKILCRLQTSPLADFLVKFLFCLILH